MDRKKKPKKKMPPGIKSSSNGHRRRCQTPTSATATMSSNSATKSSSHSPMAEDNHNSPSEMVRKAAKKDRHVSKGIEAAIDSLQANADRRLKEAETHRLKAESLERAAQSHRIASAKEEDSAHDFILIAAGLHQVLNDVQIEESKVDLLMGWWGR